MSNIRNRKFALYISLGIEANNLILSGLARKLKNFGDVQVLTRYDSVILDNNLEKFGLNKFVLADFKLMDQDRSKVEEYFLGSRRARLRLKGLKTFALWKETQDLRMKDYFIGNAIIYTLLGTLARKKISRHYINKKLTKYLQENEFTDLVIQSYAAPDRMSVIVSAQSVGCKVWIMNWGWKDFYINEFIPIVPDGFFTWSNQNKILYQEFNKHINSNRIHSLGNPSYDLLYNYRPAKSLEYYAKKYTFSLDSKIVLYTLVNPDVYLKEPDIIGTIVKEVDKSSLSGVVFLLKPNPMDDQLERFEALLQHENVTMLDNLWEYDKVNNFNMMTLEARDEWYDMLYYSTVTINIPSTVTVESLILKKPVINMCFDGSNRVSSELKRLADAPYYKPCFLRTDVVLTYNSKQVVEILQKVINNEIKVVEALDNIIFSNSDSTGEIVETIVQ